MRKALASLCLAVAALAGCSGGGSSARATPSPKLANPLGFPLYDDAAVIDVRRVKQSGYTGQEVIAATQAAFSDVDDWLDGLNAQPPAGYIAEEPQTNPEQTAQSQRNGLDYAVFRRKGGSGTHGMVVVVMDPERVNKRFGAILGMVDKYNALPTFLRGPVDNAAKARFGMTVTQAMQPGSPIAAALAAMHELQRRNARGILVIDAQKK